MSIQSVAVLSPGDMGHAVGQLLKEHELEVLTCLAGRSRRTRELSEKAGIIEVATIEELVRRADAVLAITVSEAVPGLCREAGDAVKASGSGLLYAECNAISPKLSVLVSMRRGRTLPNLKSCGNSDSMCEIWVRKWERRRASRCVTQP